MATGTRRRPSAPYARGDASAGRQGDGPAGRFAGIQRSRLLSAAIRAVDELGYSDTSVADITSRARVSRRTFYEQFPDREACLAAALEDALGVLERELAAAAGLDGLAWRERVRMGLWTILVAFDREPVLARVCVVQALRGGPRVLERREEILTGLAGVVDGGRREGARGEECSALTAEGLVGAAFGIVYARLLKGKRRPLTELLGELMGMIVLPYLGPAAARREQAMPAPAVPGGGGSVDGVGESGGAGRAVSDPLESVPMRLTYRTSRVLEGVAELGGRGADPSNRQVGEYAGIPDAGQVSKLLRRLEGLGLLANGGPGHLKGEPNAWRLTAQGELVARSIRAHSRIKERGCVMWAARRGAA
jgi:AcrR family transcriptional regulator